MRLGAYAAILKRGSRTLGLYEKTGRLEEDKARIEWFLKDEGEAFRAGVILKSERAAVERHRHRYEVNNMLRRRLETKGLVMSGINPERDLVEIIELPGHPFFMGTQFHPEFQSRFVTPHPLFTAFIKAAIQTKKTRGVQKPTELSRTLAETLVIRPR